jgi:hypothetical protein
MQAACRPATQQKEPALFPREGGPARREASHHRQCDKEHRGKARAGRGAKKKPVPHGQGSRLIEGWSHPRQCDE